MEPRGTSLIVLAVVAELALAAQAAVREEHFDRAPVNWEGINNRSTNFPSRTVTQDFGWNGSSRRIGERSGEVGGKINPAGEAAYYGYRLPRTLSLDEPMSA